MSLFEKYTKAWNEKDISAFVECHHNDYEFVIHSTGEALMLVHQLKDGLMWRTESGATPLPSKS